MNKRTTLKLKTGVNLRQKLLIRASIATLSLAIVAALIVVQTFDFKQSSASNQNGVQIILPLTIQSVCSDNPAQIRKWKVSNPNNFNVTYEWDIFPMIQSGTSSALPGENFIFTNTIAGSNQIRIKWMNENNRFRQILSQSSNQSCNLGNLYAVEVIQYLPSKRNDGTFIPEEFQNAEKALGAPENDQSSNFVSLGFGGQITLMFAEPIANGNGADFKVFETTTNNSNCQRQPKNIYAFASFDGCNYVYCGKGCQDAEFDLGALSQAKYIKIIDCSNPSSNYENQVSDAYRLDGIQSLNGQAITIIDDNLVYGSATDVVQFNQGKRKSGQPVHASRCNPQVALGVPEDDDIGSTNFVSLGFNGSITLKFDYVIFNKEGNDLIVIETSFGAPSCSAYPEKVLAEVSLDGQQWINLGTVCLDGEIDLGGLPAIQYIRLTDRSPASFFPNSADGYDLDGVLALNTCQGQARFGFYDNNNVPDEISEFTAFPNPFRDQLNLSYETGTAHEKVNFKMFNISGQQVWQNMYEFGPNSKEMIEVPTLDIPKGTYIFTSESGSLKQTQKVIKN